MPRSTFEGTTERSQEISLFRTQEENFTLWNECYFCDFGIGYGVRPPNRDDEDQMCKAIEQKMITLQGVKLPYTNTHMSHEEFVTHFGEERYEQYQQIRETHGCSQLPTIYDKIANR